MNRIIILGNGFDLSHQLPTSYSDFLWYCHTHELKLDKWGDGFYNKYVKIKPNSVGDFRNAIGNNDVDWLKENVFKNVTYSSDFFKHISRVNEFQKWVDIEQEYFNEILKMFKTNSSYHNELIRTLNKNFKIVSNVLNDYIQYVQASQDINFIDKYLELFNSELKADFEYSRDQIGLNHPRDTLFVNFNYTQTVLQYTKINHQIINIHGQVSDPKNPIIFGYGDETNEHYQQIENTNDNEFLKFFKSFQYALNSNYQDIIRFIDSDIYEVFVVGHSCGLSDRILLRDIFTADNCKNIMISYYKDQNSFLDIYQNMSRLFTDKSMLRQRVMPFDESVVCPQLIKK